MKKFKKYYEEIEKYNQSLNEVKLSRIWQYIEDDSKSFAIISAFRGQNEPEENLKLSQQLENDIKKLGYGYVAMSGGYVETDEAGIKHEVKERSFLISGISREEIIKLGIKYGQETVLYKDSNEFSYISTNTKGTVPVGQSTNVQFKKSAGQDNMTFAKEMIKNFYSSLLYGSHNHRRFAFNTIEKNLEDGQFTLFEHCPMPLNPGSYAAMAGYKSGWFKRI